MSIPNNQLQQIVDRIERLEEERAGLTADIREAYAEAKGEGFVVKVLRKVVAKRKRHVNEIREEEELIRLYQEQLS